MTTTINASTSAGLVNTADTSGVLALQTAGTTAVTIDASQNVGIGTATPQAKLHANSANNATSLLLTPNSGGTAGDYTQLAWGNSSSNPVVYGGIRTAFTSPTVTSSVSMQFWTDVGGSAYAERMRINQSGNLQLQQNLSVGGATPTTSGTGISFPATQSASSDANTLDDYEEGTWTVTDLSGAGLTITSRTGIYTKIGNMVYFSFDLIFPTTASTAQPSFSLPFNSAGSPYGGGCIAYQNANTAVTGYMDGATTKVVLYLITGTSAQNITFSGKEVAMFGSYRVA